MTLDSLSHFPLRRARVHEVCGPGALTFAVIAAAYGQGPVLWVREAWLPDIVNPLGIVTYFDPSRLLFAHTPGQVDSLAVSEEALRDGSVPTVIIEITRPLDLREGRRLQLAAKAGKSVGLCLIPQGMGSNAAETRWLAEPIFDRTDSTLMRWEIIKNKSGTLRAWNVRWDEQTRRLHVVPPAAQRPDFTPASG